jgi:IclR family transcriptional regulator, acetate operon repressor
MVKGTQTHIQSVARAAAMLEIVARRSGECRATDVAAELELALPTAHHLLNTLVAEGLLTKREDRRYQLGPKVGLLAEAFAAQASAPGHLVQLLHELARTTGETAYLSAWRDGDSVVLSIVEGHRAVRVSALHLGYSGVAHARASGKVMLAFGPPGTLQAYLRRNRLNALTDHTVVDAAELQAEIERTRDRGYGIDEEEFAEGVACIAAPVADGAMAIGISTPVERYRDARAELIEAVTATASHAMGPRLAVAGLSRPESETL